MEGILALVAVGCAFLAITFIIAAYCIREAVEWGEWFWGIFGVLFSIAVLAIGILCCIEVVNTYWPAL